LNPGLSNIESLLNNTVAPNVSLQRSTNVVPDSQLSTTSSFPPNLIQQQLSPNHRPPFSPQQNQYPQSTFNASTGQRLSPQQQIAFQTVGSGNGSVGVSVNNNNSNTNNNNSNNAQLSPRQLPPFLQGPSVQQQTSGQQQSGAQAVSVAQSQQQWNQQTANNRLSMQQQNPMLNAQLTVSLIKSAYLFSTTF